MSYEITFFPLKFYNVKFAVQCASNRLGSLGPSVPGNTKPLIFFERSPSINLLPYVSLSIEWKTQSRNLLRKWVKQRNEWNRVLELQLWATFNSREFEKEQFSTKRRKNCLLKVSGVQATVLLLGCFVCLFLLLVCWVIFEQLNNICLIWFNLEEYRIEYPESRYTVCGIGVYEYPFP